MYSNESSQVFSIKICYNFIMKIFAERLRELRIDKGLSQRGLAKQTSLSPSAIMQWENESRVPNAEAVVTLATYFEVSTDYLLGLTD